MPIYMRHLSDYSITWEEDSNKLIFEELNRFTDSEENKLKSEICEIKVSEHKEYLEYVFQTDEVEVENIEGEEECLCKFIVTTETDKMIGMVQIVSYLAQLLSMSDEDVARDVLKANIDMIDSEESDFEEDSGVRYIQ